MTKQMWYVVLFDAEGTEDEVISYEFEPTQKEIERYHQTLGYHFSGYYKTNTPEEALKIAEEEYDGLGCVA